MSQHSFRLPIQSRSPANPKLSDDQEMVVYRLIESGLSLGQLDEFVSASFGLKVNVVDLRRNLLKKFKTDTDNFSGTLSDVKCSGSSLLKSELAKPITNSVLSSTANTLKPLTIKSNAPSTTEQQIDPSEISKLTGSLHRTLLRLPPSIAEEHIHFLQNYAAYLEEISCSHDVDFDFNFNASSPVTSAFQNPGFCVVFPVESPAHSELVTRSVTTTASQSASKPTISRSSRPLRPLAPRPPNIPKVAIPVQYFVSQSAHSTISSDTSITPSSDYMNNCPSNSPLQANQQSPSKRPRIALPGP